jgi:hypothetical protein
MVYRPQVVESGWLEQVIDQGDEQRFGRNGNGAEVEFLSATREGSRRYGMAADLCIHFRGNRDFLAGVSGAWAKWSAECSWRSAGRVQLVALAAGFTD